MLRLTAHPLELKLTTPFRIARYVQPLAHNVIAEIAYNEYVGYGEAAPSEYYGETQALVLASLPTLAEQLGDNPFPIDEIIQRIDHALRLNPSAKAAIDMALYDLVGKILGVPLYKLLGLHPQGTPLTSFTIGIEDDPQVMGEKARQAKEYPVLKIKVGTKNDLANIKAIREARPDAVLRVDANTGWTPKEAIQTINAIASYNIEFIEQPVVATDLAGLKLIRENVAVPIMADESCVAVEDIPRLAGCVDAVNLKLMKSNGITTVCKMIHVARAHHLKIMLGCMIESSLAITAAAHLSPLVDYADLDGHLLVDNDPFTGVTVNEGKLILPDAPGLGVVKR